VPAAASLDALPEDQIALANGIVMQTVETAYGQRAVVSALPEGSLTDLQIGDVLLVYAATGEMIDSAQALRDLVEREMASGVATFGFAVHRDGKMAVGYIGLPQLGKADLDGKTQDLENKS
jgi:protein involved in polysaccharide export with SLBB domain